MPILIEVGWTPDHHKKTLKELKDAGHGKFVRRRMQETDVLVVDEISMVENLHFERLNAVMKEARRDDRAFGGVQLVVTGDVCCINPFHYQLADIVSSVNCRQSSLLDTASNVVKSCRG